MKKQVSIISKHFKCIDFFFFFTTRYHKKSEILHDLRSDLHQAAITRGLLGSQHSNK